MRFDCVLENNVGALVAYDGGWRVPPVTGEPSAHSETRGGRTILECVRGAGRYLHRVRDLHVPGMLHG